MVGGGTSWLPEGLRLDLELVDERRFTSGVVHLSYRIRRLAEGATTADSPLVTP